MAEIQTLKKFEALSPFEIKDEGGFQSLLDGLPVRLSPGTELERFGIVVDADTDLLKRWRSIK